MPASTSLKFVLTAFLAAGASACGGGTSLLHPAQTLGKGDVSIGAGLSSQPVLLALPSQSSVEKTETAKFLQERAIAPAIAPWIGARFGLAGDNEVGLTYSGRSLRLDGRHAFAVNKKIAISLGLGGQAILAARRELPSMPTSFSAGGLDVPVLLGWQSTGGLYAGWIGPRAGITWFTGRAALSDKAETKLAGYDARVGLVAGLRLGFRNIHVALEMAGDWHFVSGSIGEFDVSFGQLSLTPAGALITSF